MNVVLLERTTICIVHMPNRQRSALKQLSNTALTETGSTEGLKKMFLSLARSGYVAAIIASNALRQKKSLPSHLVEHDINLVTLLQLKHLRGIVRLDALAIEEESEGAR